MSEKLPRVLPLGLDGAQTSLENQKLFAKQRLELETRANFALSCGNARNLDPVLAWHLGVGKDLCKTDSDITARTGQKWGETATE